VIVDHYQHGIAVHEMSEAHLQNLFGVYQLRMGQLYASDERLRYVLVFKNFGPRTCRTRSPTAATISKNTTTASSAP